MASSGFLSKHPKTTAAADRSEYEIPRIELNASFDGILRGDSRKQLERLLPAYLRHCRWFRAKTRTMTSVHIAETMPMTEGAGRSATNAT